jgi:hypothetical protein
MIRITTNKIKDLNFLICSTRSSPFGLVVFQKNFSTIQNSNLVSFMVSATTCFWWCTIPPFSHQFFELNRQKCHNHWTFSMTISCYQIDR